MEEFVIKSGKLGKNPDRKLEILTQHLLAKHVPREQILQELHFHEMAHAAFDPDFEKAEVMIESDSQGNIKGKFTPGRGTFALYTREDALKMVEAPKNFGHGITGMSIEDRHARRVILTSNSWPPKQK